MAENLKQKLNKINLLKSIVYSAISWSYANCTFAVPQEENLSDEIFDAAMQVEGAADKYNDITNVVDSQPVEQIGDEAISAGNNVLHNAVNGLQNVGSSIGDNMDAVTGGNPLFTKLLVVFVLVFISICIIVILILLARKFVFKKTTNPFVSANNMSTDEDFDESKFENDNDDELLDEEKTTETKRTSRTIIPPKSTIERDINTVEQESVESLEQEADFQTEQIPQQEPDLKNTVNLAINNETGIYKRLTEPKDMASAMQVFLKLTAE